MNVLAIAKARSGNAKLGNAATTHAAQASCPSSCVFKDGGGCYAETGRQGMFVTRVLNERAADEQANWLDVAVAEAAAIDEMEPEPGWPMRLHTVGDCQNDHAARIVAGAAARYVERGGGPVWTYTHAWRDVARESWGNVSVLASCENEDDVLAAHERGYATALVVERFDRDQLYVFGATSVLPCPSMTRHVPCSDCRLCTDDARLLDRGYSIGFAIHGIPATQRAARTALTNPGDPDRRTPSVERIRVIRDRYLADEQREPTMAEVSAEIPDLSRASVYEWLRFLRGEIVHPAERRRTAKRRRKEMA